MIQKRLARNNIRTLWKTLQEKIDHVCPTPLIDQVYLGCTQREAKVDPQAVQSNTELFKQQTTTREEKASHVYTGPQLDQYGRRVIEHQKTKYADIKPFTRELITAMRFLFTLNLPEDTWT